jgi:hypothetical protein
MRTLNVSFIVLLLAVGAMLGQHKPKQATKKPAMKTSEVSYKQDVAPILKKYCLPCHTEDQMNPSELYLDSYQNMMEGGKHGIPIIAGRSDSSLLIQKISTKPPFGDPMPLKRKTPFPEDTLKILRTWIDHGAKDN